jgi:hypothetical protein
MLSWTDEIQSKMGSDHENLADARYPEIKGVHMNSSQMNKRTLVDLARSSRHSSRDVPIHTSFIAWLASRSSKGKRGGGGGGGGQEKGHPKVLVVAQEQSRRMSVAVCELQAMKQLCTGRPEYQTTDSTCMGGIRK